MAYGSWTGNKWLEVYNNKFYKIEVEWNYRQDPVNNKTNYRASQLKVTSINSNYTFSSAKVTAGVGVTTNTRQTANMGSQTVPKGGSITLDVYNDDRELKHNYDGSTPDCWIHYYFQPGVSGDNVPNIDWTLYKITDLIPAIDRDAPTTSVKVKSVSTNSVSLTVTSDYKTTYSRYSLDGGTNWTYVTPPSELQVANGGTGTLTISSLSPNTNYTVKWQVRRNHNELWSNKASVTFTTLTDQATAYIKQNGAWKKAKIWFKNGSWKKVKRNYAKDGTWR